MRTPSANQILLLAAALILFLSLIALAHQRPEMSVKILDPKFRLITAKIPHGTMHKIYWNPSLTTEISDLLARAGWNSHLAGPLQVRMPNDAYALAVRFTGDFAPNELAYVEAARVDASDGRISIGGRVRLAVGASKSASPTLNRF
jgi:hypothetical protein